MITAMKKIASLLSLCLIVLFSCTVERTEDIVPQTIQEPYTIHITAGEVESRTIINADEKTLLWGDHERLVVWQLVSGGKGYNGVYAVSEEGVSADGGKTMTFDVTFGGSGSDKDKGGKEDIPATGPYYYTAIYPAEAVPNPYSYEYQQVSMPALQYPAPDSFDPAGDVLLAQLRTFDEIPASLDFNFRRLASLGRIHIKNLPSGADVLSVVFSADGKFFSGNADVNLAEGERYDVYGKTDAPVKLSYKGQSVPANGLDAWLCCWPLTIQAGETFTLTVNTVDNKRYTRTVTVSGDPLVFEEGKVCAFTVNMASAVESAVDASSAAFVFDSGFDAVTGLQLDYNYNYPSINFSVPEFWEAEIVGGEGWLYLNYEYRKVTGPAGDNYLSVYARQNDGTVPRSASIILRNDYTSVTIPVVQMNDTRVALTGVSVNPEAVSLTPGDTTRLAAVFVPGDATDVTFSWSSSDSGVALVSEDGKVTANGIGAAVITLKASNSLSGGDLTATCTVTVAAPAMVEPTNYYYAVTRTWTEDSNEYSLAMLHHNDEFITLPTPTQFGNGASSVVVFGGSVYVTGTCRNGGVQTACYWKDNVLNLMPAYTSLGTIKIVGSDMYVSAFTDDGSQVFLKNWEPVLTVPYMSDRSIGCWTVYDGHIYMGGSKYLGDDSYSKIHAAYWVDGMSDEHILTEEPGPLNKVYCIDVKDGVVYAGGCIAGSSYVWVDDVPELIYYAYYLNGNQSRVEHIVQSGDDIYYIAVSYQDPWGGEMTSRPLVYKNGIQVPVYARASGDNELRIYSVCEFQGNLFMLGLCEPSSEIGGVSVKQNGCVLWKGLYSIPYWITEDEVDRMTKYSSIDGLAHNDIFVN